MEPESQWQGPQYLSRTQVQGSVSPRCSPGAQVSELTSSEPVPWVYLLVLFPLPLGDHHSWWSSSECQAHASTLQMSPEAAAVVTPLWRHHRLQDVYWEGGEKVLARSVHGGGGGVFLATHKGFQLHWHWGCHRLTVTWEDWERLSVLWELTAGRHQPRCHGVTVVAQVCSRQAGLHSWVCGSVV